MTTDVEPKDDRREKDDIACHHSVDLSQSNGDALEFREPFKSGAAKGGKLPAHDNLQANAPS